MQVHPLPGGLNGLLAETIAAATSREAQAFTREAGPCGTSVVLFGAGSLGRKILTCLRRDGIEPLAFADNSAAKWGTRIDGLQVLQPLEACLKFGDLATFAVTIWSAGHSYRQTRAQLHSMGAGRVTPVLPLLWKYADALLPHYSLDLPHRVLAQAQAMRDAYALWHDDESRRQYVAHLNMRLQADFDLLPQPSPGDQYFPEGVVALSDAEAFADVGAFDGDTIRAFLARRGTAFRRVWALEPDPVSAARLREDVSQMEPECRSRITVLELAAGARPGKVRFDAAGTTGAALSVTGQIAVQCARLDEVLGQAGPTYLKLDIEGAEQEALSGAEHLIRHRAPVIAVCVYHRPDDLWRIPLYLRSLNADYCFFVRSHGDDGWELVVYAVPAARTCALA